MPDEGHVPIGAGPDDIEAAILEDGEIVTPDVDGAEETSQSITIVTGESQNADSGDINIHTGNADGQQGAVNIQTANGLVSFFGVNAVPQQPISVVDAAHIMAALVNLGLVFDDT